MFRYLIALVVSLVFSGFLLGTYLWLNSQLPDSQTFQDHGREVTSREMLVINLVDTLLKWGWMLSLLCFVFTFAVAANIGRSDMSESSSTKPEN